MLGYLEIMKFDYIDLELYIQYIYILIYHVFIDTYRLYVYIYIYIVFQVSPSFNLKVTFEFLFKLTVSIGGHRFHLLDIVSLFHPESS